MKTIGYSRPLALCTVISVTRPSSSLRESASASSAISCRNEPSVSASGAAAASNSRPTSTSCSRFSIRPCASIVPSATSASRYPLCASTASIRSPTGTARASGCGGASGSRAPSAGAPPRERRPGHARPERGRAPPAAAPPPRGPLVDQPLDLAHDEARLGVLVLQRAHVDPLSVPELAPQALGDAAAVVGDHRVRRAQDGLRGAVVLLELDHAGIWEVVLEVEDVAHLGTAKAVDRLRIVAHDGEVAVTGKAGARAPRRGRAAAADEQLKQPVLRVVGVLVLVDEHVPECRDVALAHLGAQLEKDHPPEHHGDQ